MWGGDEVRYENDNADTILKQKRKIKGLSNENLSYIPSFFKYADGIVRINIAEYHYPKSEFNLKNEDELDEFIKTINMLYNKCNDDRISYDDDANDEYYKRDNIVSRIYHYNQLDESGIIDRLLDDVNQIL